MSTNGSPTAALRLGVGLATSAVVMTASACTQLGLASDPAAARTALAEVARPAPGWSPDGKGLTIGMDSSLAEPGEDGVWVEAEGEGEMLVTTWDVRVGDGEDPRAGRWRDTGKEECGIHFVGGRLVRGPAARAG